MADIPQFENGIFGLVSSKEWLDVGFNVQRQNDPIDGLFPDERTNNIVAYWQQLANEYQVPMMAHFHGFDTEANQTFRVPVDTRNVEKGLIKVKLNQSERMRELMRSGVRQDAMYDYVLRDGVRLADQVVTRTKVAKNELLATGKVTIKENNLDLTVDYGVTAEQTALELDLSVDADIPAQLQQIVDRALDKDFNPRPRAGGDSKTSLHSHVHLIIFTQITPFPCIFLFGIIQIHVKTSFSIGANTAMFS